MASGFSSILKISDLDDFITPSQECIKPVEKPKVVPQQASSSKIKIEIENDGTYVQVTEGKREPLAKVEVTLSDCLACSGCITSAESVLISQQSPDELYRILELNRNSKETTAFVSLGVQAVLSLANKYGMGCQETSERLAGLFQHLGANHTTSVTIAEDLALRESLEEFLQAHQNGSLPLLCGMCPGWVCYSEKLHPHALPKISKVKSPQQIMGSLIKLVYGPKNSYWPDQIYHITLMACFDRKLEASRKDFKLEEYHSKEVDVVLTPVEIEQIFEKLDKTLSDFERVPLVNLFSKEALIVDHNYQIYSHPGSGSGGYAEYIMKGAAKHLFNKEIAEINWVRGRNPDIFEAVLTDDDNKPVLKFCIATGFRNIQTIVRKIKAKTSLPHYIEIMACPTGCLNGGAQVRPSASTDSSSSRELASKLEQDYRSLQTAQTVPSQQLLCDELHSHIKSDPDLLARAMYTEFHEVEKLNLGIKW